MHTPYRQSPTMDLIEDFAGHHVMDTDCHYYMYFELMKRFYSSPVSFYLLSYTFFRYHSPSHDQRIVQVATNNHNRVYESMRRFSDEVLDK